LRQYIRPIDDPKIGQNKLKRVRKKGGGKEEGANMYASPKVANTNAATREELSPLQNIYLNKCPKGRNNSMPHLGIIAIFLRF